METTPWEALVNRLLNGVGAALDARVAAVMELDRVDGDGTLPGLIVPRGHEADGPARSGPVPVPSERLMAALQADGVVRVRAGSPLAADPLVRALTDAEDGSDAVLVAVRVADTVTGVLAAVGRSTAVLHPAVELLRPLAELLALAGAGERRGASPHDPAGSDAPTPQVVRSRWLTALGQVAAGVAHDLNNALNPIVGFAELLRAEAGNPAQVVTYAERILMAVRDGAETVRRIQRFTRRGQGGDAPSATSLVRTVRETVELTRPHWAEPDTGGPIEIVESVDPELTVPVVPGDLRQALLNLITNALDAMPDGGMLRFIGRGRGSTAVLAVQDTGSGMPPETLGRVLEPFFTTKGGKGTGLGLAEVYGVVRRYGGTIDIESWPGTGTTVLLTLPRAVPPSGEPAEASETKERVVAPTTESMGILLIDDNVLSIEATAAALRASGHRVDTATSAEAALERFEPGKYNVVLTDLGLPDRYGLDLVAELRARDPYVRVGIITGWSPDALDEDLQQHGVEMVFVKPVDPADLLSALRPRTASDRPD